MIEKFLSKRKAKLGRKINVASFQLCIFLSDYYIDASESVYSFLRGRKGGHHLVYDNYIYRSNFRRHGLEKNVFYFECIWNRNGRCRGRIKTVGDKIYRSNSNGKPHFSFEKSCNMTD